MPAYTYTLTHISDAALLADLAALVATDRQTTAALLAHLAEVEARDLFPPAACSSMHSYCTRVLRLSEDAAFKRIRAARAARRFPQLFDAIADGRLHLSGVVVLAPHFTEENVDDVIAAATHRSKADIEVIAARLAPKPDLPSALVPLAPAGEQAPLPEVAPGPVAPPPEPPPTTRTKPLSPERFGLQLTISQETRDKLERAQALLRHSNPSGDLAGVLDRALDALLEKLEKAKFGATSRPRARRARPADADPSYVPSDVRRDVHARDGERCSFVSETGERCSERGFLEFDHSDPVSLGGASTTKNVRLLCRAHNEYEADRILGADFMEAKRKAAAIEADVSAGLRRMGYSPAEVRSAMVGTAQSPPLELEARMRAALLFLARMRATRCSDGDFDVLGYTTADAAQTSHGNWRFSNLNSPLIPVVPVTDVVF